MENPAELQDDQIEAIKTCFSMDEQDVQKWAADLSTKYPKGKLSTKQLKEELNILRKGQFNEKKLVKAIFDAFDLDASDTLSFNELITGLVGAYGTNIDQKLKYCFKVYDRNFSQKLSRKEVRRILRIILIGRVQTKEEIDQYVNTVFVNVDTNSDDKITLKEFIHGCKNDSSIADVINPFV
ncbi:hypothetical protein ACOME3_000104 [Neoechinorhynchus agilis]